MTWLKYHSKSEEYASQAEVAFRHGDLSLSIKYYQLAAKEEEVALSKLDPSKKRTLGITAVSAASLWFKGRDFQKAESTAYKCLGSYSLPPFAIAQLRTILKTIWDKEFWINKINLYSQKVAKIQSGDFLSHLFEPYMDIPHLCNDAAKVFRDLLDSEGCSIFLLDEMNSTDEKKIYRCYGTTGLVVLREGIQSYIRNPLTDERATYVYMPKKEGMQSSPPEPPELPLTLGVIRARTCAFVEDISDNKCIENLFPRAYRIKRKPGIEKVSEELWEKANYLHTKCLLYAPLFYRDPSDRYIDVLGVVRVARPKGETFSDDEHHLFVSMVEHLSKAVTTARLLEFLDNVPQKTSREDLFRYVVQNIPKFIGATDCALLLRKKDKLEDKLIKWAEWRKGKVEYDPNLFIYNLNDENKRGYSGWIAKEGKKLRFNSPKELNEHFRDEHLRPKHNPDSPLSPWRFLGVPIKDPEQNTIAVLRICKSSESSPLTDDDERVLELIARLLQPRIEEFKREDIQMEQLERVLSPVLHDHILELEYFTSRELLNSFFQEIGDYSEIEEAILTILSKIWRHYNQSRIGKQESFGHLKVLTDFEFFNKLILSEIPQYRAHFIHQFVVFLIGAVIIDKLNQYYLSKINKNFFTECLKKAYPENLGFTSTSNKQFDPDKIAEHAWFITSIFHNVAYPLQQLTSWFQNITCKFLRCARPTVQDDVSLNKVLFDSNYIDAIDKLVDFNIHKLKREDNEPRKTIIEILRREMDHGIMGALLLLSDNRFNNSLVLPCASAIALHNNLLCHPSVDLIKFERNPLAFLLVFCDLFYEWARGRDHEREEFPKLTKLYMANSIADIPEHGDYGYILNKSPSLKDHPCIFASVLIDSHSDKKIREAQYSFTKFAKLKSDSVVFCMKINGELFHTSPY